MSRTDAAVLQAIAAERDYLLRFALRRLRNPEQSEDAVQSALARALSGARRFAGRSSLRTWLTSILRNAIVDAHRARAREPLLADLPVERRAAEDYGAAWDPAETLQARELAEAIDARLRRLPAWSARAFVMRELEGRSGPEIQARLAMSPGRYWQALHRARKALRSLHMLSFVTAAAMVVLLAAAGFSSPASAQGEDASSYLPRHALRFERSRPVVAVLAHNASTELTDYVVPYGILAESGVAEVLALATQDGAIRMSPALRFSAQASTREFDARFPQGADYVIVPNVYEGQHDARMLEWVRTQAARGAVIVGICDGVPVLANAGLLEGRRATGHWKTVPGLERKHPQTRWLRNRRYVADGNVITTSGVSASIPVSVALVEAIGGRARAEQVARSLGVADWSPAHDSEQFALTAGSLFTALRNKTMFWRHEALGVEVASVDEIAVALVADAYGRTRRSSALSLALERSLEGIAARYGESTAAFVALTMEYPWKHARR